MTATIVLTRTQLTQLVKITGHFQDINSFTLTQSHESGIGPAVVVSFDLFNSDDTKIDITDYASW